VCCWNLWQHIACEILTFCVVLNLWQQILRDPDILCVVDLMTTHPLWDPHILCCSFDGNTCIPLRSSLNQGQEDLWHFVCCWFYGTSPVRSCSNQGQGDVWNPLISSDQGQEYVWHFMCHWFYGNTSPVRSWHFVSPTWDSLIKDRKMSDILCAEFMATHPTEILTFCVLLSLWQHIPCEIITFYMYLILWQYILWDPP
jgi:hypothetical protein